jgi:hypothetical protein
VEPVSEDDPFLLSKARGKIRTQKTAPIEIYSDDDVDVVIPRIAGYVFLFPFPQIHSEYPPVDLLAFLQRSLLLTSVTVMQMKHLNLWFVEGGKRLLSHPIVVSKFCLRNVLFHC